MERIIKAVKINGICSNCGKKSSKLKIIIEYDDEEINIENAKLLGLK